MHAAPKATSAHRHLLPLAAALCLLGTTPAWAATEIQFWHAMTGELADKIDAIARDFNASQPDYVVKPSYRGNYSETMTGAIAAFRAGQAPTIVQIFEVGTATMMAARGATEPVYHLMEQSNQPFDPSAYLPAVTGYYSSADGQMLSMPFNSSTPVLYVNRTILDQAGVDEVPRTWEALGDALERVIDSGAARCGLTTTWPSWIQLENYAARHDLPFATEANGFAGLDTRLAFDTSEVAAHLQRLVDWQQDGRFRYGGRVDDAMPMFYSGQCAMITASSASLAGIRANAQAFDFEVAPLPWSTTALEHQGREQPLNTIIGGASLWVMAGKSAEENAAAASFFHYLSSPEVQADWHQFSGYLPITEAAYELTRESGFYDQHPGTGTAIEQLTSSEPTDNSRGLRLGNMVQVRDVIEEELERVFSGAQTVQEGLDNAVRRGNQLLERFQRANG
ncbi:sn-glycerol-3-phosphate ABC transporter substrate-binding protein UgpB [Halotalea alkalilenta]|uniref:sn-glycerol-3-phosphate-binding periplasmic protein UgpB n=1 Tax=Halotalea alkalilenta TaxID=376489 RepID=A0A172YBG3_9GAMM|nr:sn-glycerol-3-phosphate ABC transporter substrate-binding protein UgpB [Halotalea alkalilenta]ANF56456.1 sn-glycerol-3-phosphate ABC transporter substrate-binding protein [Halotalea alkalilenta]